MMDISPLGVVELPLLVITTCRELAEQESEGKGSDGEREVAGLLLRPRITIPATKQKVIERSKSRNPARSDPTPSKNREKAFPTK
jgi:hypothetical protein